MELRALINSGIIGDPVLLAKRKKPLRQRVSRIPFAPSLDTSPAGKIISAPSFCRWSVMACRESLAVLPFILSTGSSTDCRGLIAISRSLATTRTSGRTSRISLSSAKPSSEPIGWLATITTRPWRGIFSRSVSRTVNEKSKNSRTCSANSKPFKWGYWDSKYLNCRSLNSSLNSWVSRL